MQGRLGFRMTSEGRMEPWKLQPEPEPPTEAAEALNGEKEQRSAGNPQLCIRQPRVQELNLSGGVSAWIPDVGSDRERRRKKRERKKRADGLEGDLAQHRLLRSLRISFVGCASAS